MATSLVIDKFAKQFDRVLVVGGSGFIGRRVAEILGSNDIEVFSTFRTQKSISLSDSSAAQKVSHVRLGESSDVHELMKDLNPKLVVNLATFFTKLDDADLTQPLIDSNVSLVAHVAQSCANLKLPLVQAQSAWQTSSEGALDPLTPYFLYKQIGQEICEWYGLNRDLRVNFVRFFDTYGPNDTRQKIVNMLVSAFECGTSLNLSGGDQIVNLLHVDDAAMGVIASALGFDQGDQLETYWCSGQNDLTLKELVEHFSILYGMSPEINWGAMPYRPGEIFQPWRFKMNAPPFWSQTIDLKSGIQSLIGNES